MIRIVTYSLALLTALSLSACYSGPVGSQRAPGPVPAGTGQYQYPQYLRPEPRLYTPQRDLCNATLYQGLEGQHIGGVQVGVIAGNKRIIQPAELELDEDDFLADMRPEPPLLRVTELLAGQPLYAASVRTGVYRGQLGPDQPDRLTLELDAQGYILDVMCR